MNWEPEGPVGVGGLAVPTGETVPPNVFVTGGFGGWAGGFGGWAGWAGRLDGRGGPGGGRTGPRLVLVMGKVNLLPGLGIYFRRFSLKSSGT